MEKKKKKKNVKKRVKKVAMKGETKRVGSFEDFQEGEG